MKHASILATALLTMTIVANFLPRETAAGIAPREKQKHFALLIGNTDYAPEVVPLANPVKDIRLIEKSLTKVGFGKKQIKRVENGTRTEILSAVDEYADKLAAAGKDAVGFFYYSGHGIALEDDGRNYLIPIDVTRIDRKVRYNAVPLQEVVDRLSQVAPKAAHFVIFDACRNVLNTRARGSKGFRAVRSKAGMLIAFSTEPGQTASDVGEASGPYAAALAKNIVKPGLSHLDVFQNVKEDVLAATDNQQLSWERNGLTRRVYLSSQIKPKNKVIRPKKSGNQLAILIGASDSSNTKPSIPSVPGAQTDVEDMASLLVTRFGFRTSNILKLVGKHATGKEIDNALKGVYRRAKVGDQLFILLAGHGTDGKAALSLTGRQLKAELRAKISRQRFFLPADANLPELNEILSPTFLMGYLKEFASKGIRTTAIFDSTQGLVTEPISNTAVYSPPIAVEFVSFLNGASKVRGAFTTSVILGLDGQADDDGDGLVTHKELKAFLIERHFRNNKAYSYGEEVGTVWTRSEGSGTKDGLLVIAKRDLDQVVLQPVQN